MFCLRKNKRAHVHVEQCIRRKIEVVLQLPAKQLAPLRVQAGPRMWRQTDGHGRTLTAALYCTASVPLAPYICEALACEEETSSNTGAARLYDNQSSDGLIRTMCYMNCLTTCTAAAWCQSRPQLEAFKLHRLLMYHKCCGPQHVVKCFSQQALLRSWSTP